VSFGQTCHDAGIARSMGAVGSCFVDLSVDSIEHPERHPLMAKH
jgi:hypothetical protein